MLAAKNSDVLVMPKGHGQSVAVLKHRDVWVSYSTLRRRIGSYVRSIR